MCVVRPVREVGNCERTTVTSGQREINGTKDGHPGASTLFTELFNFLRCVAVTREFVMLLFTPGMVDLSCVCMKDFITNFKYNFIEVLDN